MPPTDREKGGGGEGGVIRGWVCYEWRGWV